MHNPASPIFVTCRTALRDTEIGGFKIPAGVTCVLNTQGMAADERFFPKPQVCCAQHGPVSLLGKPTPSGTVTLDHHL